MNHFEELIADVIKKYPSLSAHSTEKGVLLKGPLVMYSEYNDIPLYDEYEMKNGILYIYSEENDNTTFEAQYISDKVRYSIFYMNENNNFSYNYLKEKMIEYAKYFEAK